MTPIREASAETRAITLRLLKCQVGDIVTYDELSKLAKHPIHEKWGWLTSARKAAIRDGIMFDVVRNVGLKRMSAEEIVASGASRLTRIRRGARRGDKEQKLARNADGLSADQRAMNNAYMAMFQWVAHMARPARVEKLIETVKADQPMRDYISTTLAAFKGD